MTQAQGKTAKIKRNEAVNLVPYLGHSLKLLSRYLFLSYLGKSASTLNRFRTCSDPPTFTGTERFCIQNQYSFSRVGRASLKIKGIWHLNEGLFKRWWCHILSKKKADKPFFLLNGFAQNFTWWIAGSELLYSSSPPSAEGTEAGCASHSRSAHRSEQSHICGRVTENILLY